MAQMVLLVIAKASSGLPFRSVRRVKDSVRFEGIGGARSVTIGTRTCAIARARVWYACA